MSEEDWEEGEKGDWCNACGNLQFSIELVNAFQWLIEEEEEVEDRWLMFYLLRLAIEVNGLHRACVRCPLTHR